MNASSSIFAQRYALGPSLAAAAVLAIGMGFGRFAFTGLYPLMISDQILTVYSGTLAASANYAGYLAGALLVARARPSDARGLSIATAIISIVCMGALAWIHGPWAIVVIRGLAGIVSAISMIAASLWLLQHMGHAHGAPLLYSGVGAGIVLSAELIAAGHAAGLDSSMIWLVLAISSLVMVLVAMPALGAQPKPELHFGRDGSSAREDNSSILDAVRLIVIYGLAGFGYVITATYLPLLIKGALGSVNPIEVWAVFGLGAVPSCFLWHTLQVRYGTRFSLVLNLVVQAIGVVLPALDHSALSYLTSALLVGGTFMGTVTIAMPAARRVAHAVRFNMLAGMTAAYGIGQIVGPLVANALYTSSHTFTGSLFTAMGTLILAAILAIGVGPAHIR
ncbi:MFS transporter [Paraburkholderia steynii]|uniref:MFS transporter n=1 Tax=Paraburkholderia steynii TaxID=1245441 RepID=A0A4R0X3C7_9BURK|nr:MFS transporter [Paraburkholderia steynii]